MALAVVLQPTIVVVGECDVVLAVEMPDEAEDDADEQQPPLAELPAVEAADETGEEMDEPGEEAAEW